MCVRERLFDRSGEGGTCEVRGLSPRTHGHHTGDHHLARPKSSRRRWLGPSLSRRRPSIRPSVSAVPVVFSAVISNGYGKAPLRWCCCRSCTLSFSSITIIYCCRRVRTDKERRLNTSGHNIALSLIYFRDWCNRRAPLVVPPPPPPAFLAPIDTYLSLSYCRWAELKCMRAASGVE